MRRAIVAGNWKKNNYIEFIDFNNIALPWYLSEI